MVKALARAHRRQRMLDTSRYQTVRDLAKAENINPSYVARTLRLTLLAPDIVEAILDGRQGPEVTLARLMEGFAEEWQRQHLDTIGARGYYLHDFPAKCMKVRSRDGGTNDKRS